MAQQSGIHAINHLLCHVLHCSLTELFAYPDQSLSTTQQQQLMRCVSQYRAGKPLAQITGHCEFFSLPFEITPSVLIPRPETELLVSTVLQYMKPGATVLELGVGCGAIAIALAKNYPGISRIIATDIKSDALQLARKNAARNHVNKIEFLHGNWFDAVASHQTFDIIVSNPPYVAIEDIHLDSNVAAYEPAVALFGGDKGLDHLDTIISQSYSYLEVPGVLALEHAPFQRTAVAALMTRAGLSQLCCHKDLAHLPRVTIAQRLNRMLSSNPDS